MTVVRSLVTKWGFQVDDAPLKKVSQAVDNLKSDLTKIGIALTGAGVAVGFFAKKAGEMEQTQIAFETMLGSAEKAQRLIAEITEFAKTTPFNLSGLVDTSKKLLAFGFAANDIIPVLTTLGNITAGIGTEKMPQLLLAFGQVRAATRLTGSELRQFTEAGVPLLGELAKGMGITEAAVTDLISAGKISFQDVQNALNAMATGSGRFNNLMTKQSKTLLGSWSNLVDVLEVVSVEIGRELIPVLTPLIKRFTEFITANKEIAKIRIAQFFKAIIEVAIPVAEKAMDVARAFIGVADSFGSVEGTVKMLVRWFSILFAVKMATNIGRVAIGLFTFAKNIRMAAAGVSVFSLAAGGLPAIIGGIIVALFLLAEDVYTYFQGGKSITGLMVKGFEKLSTKVGPIFEKISNSIMNFFDVKSLFTGFMDRVKELGGSIVDAMKEPILQFAFWLEAKIAQMIDMAKSIGTKAKEATGEATVGFFRSMADFFGIATQPTTPKQGEQPVPVQMVPYQGAPLAPGKTMDAIKSMGQGAAAPVFQSAPQPSAMAPMNSQSTSNNVTITAPINVTVPPGSDADGIARRVGQEVKSTIDKTMRETHSSVKPQVSY